MATRKSTGRALRKAQRRSDGTDARADGGLDQLGRGPRAEGFHEAGLVELGGAARDPQDGGDLLGRATLGDELEDLPLARRQVVQRLDAGRGPAPERAQEVAGDLRGDVRPALEHLPERRYQLGG